LVINHEGKGRLGRYSVDKRMDEWMNEWMNE
jgi:hypothetical protein